MHGPVLSIEKKRTLSRLTGSKIPEDYLRNEVYDDKMIISIMSCFPRGGKRGVYRDREGIQMMTYRKVKGYKSRTGMLQALQRFGEVWLIRLIWLVGRSMKRSRSRA